MANLFKKFLSSRGCGFEWLAIINFHPKNEGKPNKCATHKISSAESEIVLGTHREVQGMQSEWLAASTEVPINQIVWINNKVWFLHWIWVYLKKIVIFQLEHVAWKLFMDEPFFIL